MPGSRSWGSSLTNSVKVAVDSKSRAEVMQITDIFRAKIVDVQSKSLTIEVTGNDLALPPADGVQPSRNQIFGPGPDGRAVPAHSLSPATLQSLIDAGLNPEVLTGGLR